jgi:hypothetical protein
MQIIKKTHKDKTIEKLRIERLHDIRIAAKSLLKHLGDSFVQSFDEDEFFDAYDNLCVSLKKYEDIKDNG